MAESDKKDVVNQSKNTSASAESVSTNNSAAIPAPTYQLKKEEEPNQEDKGTSEKKSGLSSNSGGSGDGDTPPLDQEKWKALFPGVKFNFNSNKPSQLGAKAYAQGNEIHFAPGQNDTHTVAHEAAHVVQQKNGKVNPTGSVNGMNVNTDPTLEAEADAVAEKVTSGGVEAANSELGSLKSMPYSNSKDSSAQMLGWRDFTPDFIEDGIDYVGDKVEDLTEAGMEAALRLIDDAESLLSYLANLSAGMAQAAVAFVAKNMKSLFIKLINAAPGHELIYYGIKAIMDIYSIEEVVSFLQNFGEDAAKAVLRLIKNIRILTLKDIVLFLPRYALSGFILALLTGEMILELLLELAVDKLTSLIRMAKTYAIGIKKLLGVIASNIDTIYDKVKAAFVALGVEFVDALIRSYSIMLEIVKKIVEKIWPIGAGVQLDAGIGATFGIPLYVGVNYVCYIVHQSPGVFKLFRRGIVKGGVDTGVGVGASIGSGKPGAGGGDTDSSLMLGAEAGANAQAGLKVEVMQEFEFPIYQDMAFISFLATATGKDTGAGFTLASKLLAPTGANLDPMVYNTKTQFKFGVYGEASAEANAGVRVGNDHTGGEAQTWEGNEAKPDSLGGVSGGPWYAPSMLLRKLRVSIGANISAEANMGIEMRQGNFGEDENGMRIPQEVELDVFGEGTFAANLAASLPVPVPIPNLGVDTTLGLKATYKFKRNGSDDDIAVEYKRYSVYVNGGDMDVVDGNATENEISIEGDADLGFQDFLQEAELSFKRKQRLSLQSSFGRSFQSRANRQEFTRVLNGDGHNFGANVAGYLTYEFMLSSGNAKRILGLMAAFYEDRVADGEWQFLIDDLITLFSTGQMAPYLEQFIDDILACLNVTMLQARWSASLGVAADASAGAGAKVRLHGNLSAGVFRNYDLIAEGQTLTVQEIRELLLSGASAVGLGGEEQQMVPQGGGSDTEVEVTPEADSTAAQETATPLALTGSSESPALANRGLTESTSELTPEQQEEQAAYTDAEKVELDSVKYELIGHGMAYQTNLEGQHIEALKGMGLTGWVDTVNTNATTGLFAGLIMPLEEQDMNLGAELTDADREYLSQRRPVIAFRGSEMGDVGNDEGGQFVLDWLQNDMDGYAVGHTAFNLNYEAIEAMLVYAVSTSGKRVVVTGHSLGGSLAKQCALHFPQYVEQVYTYQAPGIEGTGKDILGRELTEEQEAELRAMLFNEDNSQHTMGDIDFVSHTSAGDIVHNAGGGRAPGSQRRHHQPAGILNGWTPVAHTLYLTSSEEFSEQHETLNRIMGNQVGEDATGEDHANTLFDNSTIAETDVDPTRIKGDSEETDSTRYETMEALRRALIGNAFNPQAKLLVENPGMISGIPVESKIIMLNNLLRDAGFNPFKNGADLRNGNRAVVNLFVHSSPTEQLQMVNASGGFTALYNRIDGTLNNMFSSRTSDLRQAFMNGVLPILSEGSVVSTILYAMDSGVLGMGDNSEEKLIADLLLAQSAAKGRSILETLGGGDYDAGLKKILRKLQGEQDSAVRERYPLDNKRGWFR